MQAKGGAFYDIDDNVSIFGNVGYVEKPPIMDNVIYYDGTVASDPSNEKYISMEAGVNFKSENFAVKANVYNTDWKDRNLTKSVTTGQGDSGDTDVIFLSGIEQSHKGLEIEADTKISDMLSLNAAISLGTWKFTGDADGNYQENEYNAEGQVIGLKSTPYTYALDGLNVGDMPQTAYIVGATLTPVKGLKVAGIYRMYDNNYSDWSPDAREVKSGKEPDRDQVWMAPAYNKLDLHAAYTLPISGYNVTLTGHVFNALDEVFVQDAVDHSQYNSYGSKTHAAHNAEVFLGTPRSFNLGLSVNF
jgi:hypothetical protein